LRHAAAVTFLRAGGDVFTLRRILGHSTLAMTRNYVTLTDTDIKVAHLRASPADRLYRQGFR
jgi:integrase/recombinase XerD